MIAMCCYHGTTSEKYYYDTISNFIYRHNYTQNSQYKVIPPLLQFLLLRYVLKHFVVLLSEILSMYYHQQSYYSATIKVLITVLYSTLLLRYSLS